MVRPCLTESVPSTTLNDLQIALFISETVLGTGHAMNWKWVVDGSAGTGLFCSVQGTFNEICFRGRNDAKIRAAAVLRQVGGTGVALTALVSP